MVASVFVFLDFDIVWGGVEGGRSSDGPFRGVHVFFGFWVTPFQGGKIEGPGGLPPEFRALKDLVDGLFGRAVLAPGGQAEEQKENDCFHGG
jgi:hypothetical protein